MLLAIASAAVSKEQELPDVNEDGLRRVPDTKMAIVYADPEADLSGYQKVQLLDAYVAFRKSWERDQRSSGSHFEGLGGAPSQCVERSEGRCSSEITRVINSARPRNIARQSRVDIECILFAP